MPNISGGDGIWGLRPPALNRRRASVLAPSNLDARTGRARTSPTNCLRATGSVGRGLWCARFSWRARLTESIEIVNMNQRDKLDLRKIFIPVSKLALESHWDFENCFKDPVSISILRFANRGCGRDISLFQRPAVSGPSLGYDPRPVAEIGADQFEIDIARAAPELTAIGAVTAADFGPRPYANAVGVRCPSRAGD
jgi:hypothetical protein